MKTVATLDEKDICEAVREWLEKHHGLRGGDCRWNNAYYDKELRRPQNRIDVDVEVVVKPPEGGPYR